MNNTGSSTNVQKEIFKNLPNYVGIYQVSNLGNVRSIKRKIILKPRVSPQGYYQINLNKNGSGETAAIHQLVAIVFLGHTRCGYKLVVNHKNFIKTDNRLENLEVVTNKQNTNKKHLRLKGSGSGVTFNKKSKIYEAKIYLGSFKTKEEAITFREKAMALLVNFT